MFPPGHRGADEQYRLTAPVDPRHGRVSPGAAASSGVHLSSVKESGQGAGVERAGYQHAQMPALPLPDYESLFPKKRHGIMGQTRWDHIIAEVNQRRLERAADMSGPEMSVDGPAEERPVLLETPVRKGKSTANMSQSPLRREEARQERSGATTGSGAKQALHSSGATTGSGAKQALQPPKPTAAATPRQQVEKETLVAKPRQGNERNVLSVEHRLPQEPPVPAVRATQINNNNSDRKSADVLKADKQLPSVKPRQKTPAKEAMKNVQPEAHHDRNTDSFQSRDHWNIPQPSQNDLFSRGTKKQIDIEELGVTAEDIDHIFESHRSIDTFSNISQSDTGESTEQEPEKPVDIIPETFSKKRRAPKPPVSAGLTGNDSMEKQGGHSGQIRSDALKPEPEVNTQDETGPGEEPWEPERVSTPSPLTAASTDTRPESPRAEAGDSATHPAGLKTPVRAWVSPTDTVQSAAPQSSSGGPMSALRR